MRDCMDVGSIVSRLRKVEGQVRGITNMVQKDVPCEDILVQIAAVRSALHKTGQIILEGHLHHCVLDGIEAGNADDTIKKLAKALDQFVRIGK